MLFSKNKRGFTNGKLSKQAENLISPEEAFNTIINTFHTTFYLLKLIKK